jgi:cytochrome c
MIRTVQAVLTGCLCIVLYACNFEKNRLIERPADIWIFRSVLDDRPRMITMGLHKNLWLSYSTENGSLYKAWTGGFTGNIFTDGEQPRSAGALYFQEIEENPWRLISPEGSMLYPIVQYKGHALSSDQSVWLSYDLKIEDMPSINVKERPEYETREDGTVILVREFSVKSLPEGYSLQLAMHPGAACTGLELKDAAFLSENGGQIISGAPAAAGYLHMTQDGKASVSMQLKTTGNVQHSQPANPAEEAVALINGSDCNNCHNKEVKTVGPSFKAIADRYKGNMDAPMLLAEKIRKGGSGAWGIVPMTPHPDLGKQEALKIAGYILQMHSEINGIEEVKKTQKNLLKQAPYGLELDTAYSPGDGMPLTSLHPMLELEQARPPGFIPRVGAMDFLPDGRLVVATWDSTGGIYLLDRVQEADSTAITVKRIAFGLAEVLGMKVVDGDIYVLQKQELTRLVDTDKDDIIDEFQVVCNGWGVSSNFHEFAFGLVYKDGFFYGTFATALNPGGASASVQMPGRGCVIRISKADGSFEFIAGGLRTPNGIGTGPDGEIFISDNQGDWLPANKLLHLKNGAWYGSRASNFPGLSTVQETPPLVYLQQDEIANSPSQPILFNKGIYKQQLLMGDITYGGLQRVFIDKVGNQSQGCVFRFTQGLEAGVNRLLWGPDNKLYVGGCGQRGNWAQQGKNQYGLQKLSINPARITFEMLAVRAVAGGLEIEFTKPVAANSFIKKDDFLVRQWHYTPTAEYGGPKQEEERVAVKRVELRANGTRVFLELDSLKAGKVVYLRLNKKQVRAANSEPLWTTEAWYTMNRLP